MRAQLSQERDTMRHETLSKDLELKEIRARIDKTVRSFPVAMITILNL